MCGAALSGLTSASGIHLTNDDHVLLTVVAMSACLNAVVGAPLTSILIVFEMTHEFALVPALLVGRVDQPDDQPRRCCTIIFYEQVLLCRRPYDEAPSCRRATCGAGGSIRFRPSPTIIPTS